MPHHQVSNFQTRHVERLRIGHAGVATQFSFETRFRLLPKNFGIYGGRRFSTWRRWVATDTLSFEDYLQARKYALVGAAFWRDDHLHPR